MPRCYKGATHTRELLSKEQLPVAHPVGTTTQHKKTNLDISVAHWNTRRDGVTPLTDSNRQQRSNPVCKNPRISLGRWNLTIR